MGKSIFTKVSCSNEKKKFSFFFFTKAQTCSSVDFDLCLTITFVQSLLLNLNTHHSWIVRSLWPRNSFKYQIYNKRSETAQKKLWISTGVNCKNLFEKRNRRKQEVPSFRVPEKKFASPCTILRRFCPFVCALLFRLQSFIASFQNAYVW